MQAIHLYHFKRFVSCGSIKERCCRSPEVCRVFHPKSLIEHSSFISKCRNLHLSVKMRVIADQIHSLKLQGSKPLLLLKHSLRKGEEGLGVSFRQRRAFPSRDFICKVNGACVSLATALNQRWICTSSLSEASASIFPPLGF
jgi:hypothetical protein